MYWAGLEKTILRKDRGILALPVWLALLNHLSLAFCRLSLTAFASVPVCLTGALVVEVVKPTQLELNLVAMLLGHAKCYINTKCDET